MLPTAWTSDHLHVRYLRSDDLPEVVRILAKPEVCAEVMFGPNTEAETRGYFEPLLVEQAAALDRGERPGSPIFALVDPATGALAGDAAALAVPYAPGCWMIGYQLDAPFWGRGFGTWGARFVVQHALFDLDARRITGDCFVTNAASTRILEGVGLRREGVQRDHFLRDGEPVDNVLLGGLRDELIERARSWREAFTPA